MKDKIIKILEKYQRILVLLCIAVAVLGLIISYAFPNKILVTKEINIDNTTEYRLPLTKEESIVYQCNSGETPMIGIQVGISKEGGTFTDGKIVYEVYNKEGKLLGMGEQLLKDTFDTQDVYLPFPSKKGYMGDLEIKFSYVGSDLTNPALLANKKSVVEKDNKAATYVQESQITGNLRTFYIYSRNTYPLVFDLKIMLAIFVTVFFTLESKKKQKVMKFYE